MGYESYILRPAAYQGHLVAAKETLPGLLTARKDASIAVDGCLAAASDDLLSAALSGMWNDHMGPLFNATYARAENATSMAEEVLRSILAADAAAAEAAEMDPLVNDQRIYDAQEEAWRAADQSDAWNPAWQSVREEQRKV